MFLSDHQKVEEQAALHVVPLKVQRRQHLDQRRTRQEVFVAVVTTERLIHIISVVGSHLQPGAGGVNPPPEAVRSRCVCSCSCGSSAVHRLCWFLCSGACLHAERSFDSSPRPSLAPGAAARYQISPVRPPLYQPCCPPAKQMTAALHARRRLSLCDK